MQQNKGISCFCIGFIVAAVFFVFICGSAHAAKNSLMIGFEDVVGTMNYYQTTARVDIQTAMLIYDPLLEREAKTGNLLPHLVTEWKTLNDTTWEFKLRPGVKFHNGSISGQACYFGIYEIVLPHGSETATPLSRSTVPRYLAWQQRPDHFCRS
jgi:ABC-type transport system substrate-binding protein